MRIEALTRDSIDVDSYTHLSKDDILDQTGQLFFKQDRLYKHRMFRINYTTYDVRRGQDIVNPNTSHLDIMMLNDSSEAGEEEPRFLYARVLGIYHTNVVFTGSGSIDHQPRRLEFLWIRWFEPSPAMGWDSQRLDCVRFFPVDHEHAFGFLDPGDVMRSCHILPREALGKSTLGKLSGLAKDKNDWQYYYVNRFLIPLSLCLLWAYVSRFVDRDMLMRFYWGMGVGHTYSHGEQENVEEDNDFIDEESADETSEERDEVTNKDTGDFGAESEGEQLLEKVLGELDIDDSDTDPWCDSNGDDDSDSDQNEDDEEDGPSDNND